MIITKLSGGMGNQMFQYAVGRSLAHARGEDFKIDITIFASQTKDMFPFRHYDLGVFAIQESIASEMELRPFRRLEPRTGKLSFVYNSLFTDKVRYRKERFFHFDPDILNTKGPVYLDGYWQSEKYFESIKDIIKKDFQLKDAKLTRETDRILERIRSVQSVAMNIRRADFVSKQKTAQYHGSMGANYFARATKLLSQIRHEELEIFIFSDDLAWCKENIKTEYSTTFVEEEHAGEKFEKYHYLMRNCKHFIIPNSSFAWWAAWLSENADKTVIAPRRWFNNAPENNTNDLFPEDWVTI